MIRPSRRASIVLVAATTILTTLALAPRAVGATSPGRNGLIAFQAVTDDGIQIFTVRSNGKDLRQLTHVDGDAAVPDWSPDGRRIAFALNECSVAVMDADGSDMDVIASDPDLCQGDPSYTPDGARLLFVRFDPVADVEEIWSMKTDGSDRRFVTDSAGRTRTCHRMARRSASRAGPTGRCSSRTSMVAGPSRSRRRSPSRTSTTGRRMASTLSSATTRSQLRRNPSTS